MQYIFIIEPVTLEKTGIRITGFVIAYNLKCAKKTALEYAKNHPELLTRKIRVKIFEVPRDCLFVEIKEDYLIQGDKKIPPLYDRYLINPKHLTPD